PAGHGVCCQPAARPGRPANPPGHRGVAEPGAAVLPSRRAAAGPRGLDSLGSLCARHADLRDECCPRPASQSPDASDFRNREDFGSLCRRTFGGGRSVKTGSTLCTPDAAALPVSRARWLDFVELTKPRIAVLVLFTVAIGAML